MTSSYMTCDKCGSEKVEKYQKIKGRWNFKCQVCGSVSKQSQTRRDRCVCGLLQSECDGKHTRWVEYADLMGEERYHISRGATEYIAPIIGKGK